MTSVEEPPLNYKNNIQLTNNFSHLTCSVSVEYCIYDPKKKKILNAKQNKGESSFSSDQDMNINDDDENYDL